MNNFFGGSDTPDYQSWLDLDTVETKANLLKEFFVSLI